MLFHCHAILNKIGCRLEKNYLHQHLQNINYLKYLMKNCRPNDFNYNKLSIYCNKISKLLCYYKQVTLFSILKIILLF